MARSGEPGRSGGELRAQWRERLRRFEKRPGTVAAFCEAESVSVWSLYDWRRKLMADEDSGGEAHAPAAVPFVEVGTMRLAADDRGAAPAPLSAGIELRIELGGGMVLQIRKR